VKRVALSLVLCGLVACGDDDSSDVGADSGAADSGAVDAAADSSTDAGPDSPDVSFDGGRDVVMPSSARERLGLRGPEVVGFRELEVSYERPDGGESRDVRLLAWYPGSVDEGARPQYTLRQSTVARQDVEAKPGSYPVLMFSHGHQAIPDALAYVMEHFASHGWIVLAPEHTGNTVVDGDERTTEIYYLRPHDVLASLDFALADGFLGGLMGSPRVLSGHSFGGYTAYALAGASYDVDAIRDGCADESLTSPICEGLTEEALMLFDAGFADDRYDALLAMASGDFHLFDDFSDVSIPVMQMVAENDGHPAGSVGDDDYWNALDGAGDLRWNLLGGAHNSFTDICVMIPGFDRCSEQDAATEIDLVKLFALAFVRDRLMSDADAAMVLGEGDELVELTPRE
jgi:predicted dienelactone hydrolase